MKIKIKKLNSDAIIPSYAHPGDVGMDLHSLEDYELKPGERRVFYIGFAAEFPTGYAAIVKDKGSTAVKGGLHTLAGVFDAGYRGEYGIVIINIGSEPYAIKKGDKIAQLIIYPVEIAEIEETEELSDTKRREGRFGSTGR